MDFCVAVSKGQVHTVLMPRSGVVLPNALVDQDGKLGTQGFDGSKMVLPDAHGVHPQPMLNEFRGEHRNVEELKAWITKLDSRGVRQEAVIAEQRKQLAILATQLKEQAAQIQKVSAQVELKKTVSRRVANK